MSRQATLTAAHVDEIRRLHAGAVRPRQIGEIVGVSIRTVNEVLSGRRHGRALTPREQADLDAQQGWRAACMDDQEWAEWVARNPLYIGDTAATARPCTDCPLGFAADMRAQGRCNGTPGGVAADPDEPEEEEPVEPIIPPRPDPGIRIAVTLQAPCPACEKADVCSLRPSVEALAELPVLAPALDPRVGLELAGSVTCTAFVKARIRKADAGELEGKRGRAAAAAGGELTAHQAEVLEVVLRNGGDRKAAAKELRTTAQDIGVTLAGVQRKGKLPAELSGAAA